jgi:hypothetical protein
MITTRNNIFYINTLNYNKNNNIYNTNNTIFDLNTLNYKKKIIIFITHIIILTHVIGCGHVQPTLGLGMDASTPTLGVGVAMCPKVALGSALLSGVAQAPGGARSPLHKGWAASAPAILAWAASGVRFSWPAAPPKFVLTIFSPNQLFNAICTPVKKTTTSLPYCPCNSLCQGLSCHYTAPIHSVLCLCKQ